jgi:PAS domain S-box-containing protein
MYKLFVTNILIALGYFILGEAGLSLAIPPGYASPIFPASAVGLVAVLQYGWRVLPSVFLGSLFVNLIISSEQGAFSKTVYLVSISIAIGASIQAWVAAKLVQYRIGDNWKKLVNDSDIIWFLLLGSFFGTLVSCTWAVNSLLFAGFIKFSDSFFNWWNWWIGDSLGSLLFSPFLLAIIYRHQSFWQIRFYNVFFPIILLSTALVSTFVVLSKKDYQVEIQNVNKQGEEISYFVDLALLTYQENVNSLARLFTISPKLSRVDFDEYTNPIFETYSDINALSWNPFITSQERKNFENFFGKENSLDNFQITERNALQQLIPANFREWYVAVGYIAPKKSNEKALGFDIASNPARLATILSSMQSGKLTATPPIRLVQDNNSIGLLLLQPVYGSQETKTLKGFAVGVFKIEAALSKLVGEKLSKNLLFKLEDLDANSENSLLYSNLYDDAKIESKMIWVKKIDFAGRHWQMTLYPTSQFLVEHRSLVTWVILAMGLVIASLLQAMLLGITGREFSIQQQVEQQTEDISEKNLVLLENQKNLLLEKEKFESLLQASADGIHILDKDGYVREANPKFCEMLGYSYKEIIGMSVTQWEAHFNPEDAAKKISENFGQANIFETRHLRKDGEIIDVEVNTRAISFNGETLLWNSSRDISERKRTEFERNLLHTIVLEAPTFIASFDIEGNVTFLNGAGARMIGITQYSDVTNLNIKDIFPDWAALVHKYGLDIAIKKGFWEGETALLDKFNQTEIPVSQLLLVHYDEKRNPKQFSTIIRDITEYKNIEKMLMLAKNKAEGLAIAKSQFLANMSHEIRTPMNGIIGLSKLALNCQMPDDLRDYLNNIHKSSEGLLGILNDILDFSKLDAGKLTIDCQRFDLDVLLADLHNLFKPKAKEKELMLAINVDKHVPVDLIGDSLRIQQVLSNLIGNAIKFTETGAVRISIQLVEIEQSIAKIGFSISDTGIGLTKDDQERLFQPFIQVDSSATRRYGGTGLGLVISQQLLHLMNSELILKSELGKGSEFSFVLPISVASKKIHRLIHNKSNANKAGEIEQKIRQDAIQLSGKRILVAEDNAINQQVVKGFLNFAGMNVDLAVNGLEAIQLMKQHHYDAVLMDVHMPDLDGIQATQQLRMQQQFSATPIIALTAGVTDEEHQSCLNSGMNDFITKPVIPEQLIAVLLHWIEPSESLTKNTELKSPLVNEEVTIQYKNLDGFELVRLKTLELILGSEEKVFQMLVKFIQDFDNTEDEIKKCITENDTDRLRKKIHALKGCASNVGAVEIAQLTKQIEQEILAEGDVTSLLDLLFKNWEMLKNTVSILNIGNTEEDIADKEIDFKILKNTLLELNSLLSDNKMVSDEVLKSILLNSPNELITDVKELQINVENYDYNNAIQIVNDLLKKFSHA